MDEIAWDAHHSYGSFWLFFALVVPSDTYAIMPGDNSRKDLKPKHVNKYVFMICTMIDALNLAARYYEDQHCEKEKANYDYSYTFFSHMSLPEDNMTIAK
ncbi:MAG: hypothetical protein MUF00_18220 [Gemmatimonadaceae bacterium]|jgi:hypothetical protein|nr:hypothetical protein [Gemmatimonadaceae bacterium]